MMLPKYRILRVAFLIFLIPSFASAGYVWDINMPLPQDDPRWLTVAEMWQNHWDGKNIDAMIDICHQLDKTFPERIEPSLWLGRLYYIKGQFQMKKRAMYHKKAEGYAVKAHNIDNTNFCAFFILVHALSSRTDKKAILQEYGDWIKAMAPLPTGEDLPAMPPSTERDQAMTLWKNRIEIANLEKAVKLFETIADKNPKDDLAQLWAGYAYHHLGAYYSYMDHHDEKGVPCYKTSVDYLNKSLDINPYSVPAHYWCQLSMARRIEKANVVTQALYLKPIMDHLLFCIQENALYNSCAPVYIVAAMIVEAGWVCKKGMEMAGYTVEMVMLALEIGEILYPDQYFIPYIHAALLDKYQKKPGEAKAVLERVLKKGLPEGNDPNHIEKTINYGRARRFHDRLVSDEGKG